MKKALLSITAVVLALFGTTAAAAASAGVGPGCCPFCR